MPPGRTNPDRAIAATFRALPGASFVVNGAAQAHDSALTTASAALKWQNGFSLAATFDGEFSSVTRSYAGKGVVRYAQQIATQERSGPDRRWLRPSLLQAWAYGAQLASRLQKRQANSAVTVPVAVNQELAVARPLS